MTARGELPTVLVVDDHPNMLRLMTKVLRGDARVLVARGGKEAVDLLSREPVVVVLADLRMPEVDGIAVLQACRRLQPEAAVILMTAYASVPSAVEALRMGVYDYLTKPFEPEVARKVILRALGHAPVQPSSDTDVQTQELLPGVIGASASMRQLASLIRRFAAGDATVLLLGETGTGKERIARAIHHLSPRASQHFVAADCAAIPAELLDNELFGFSSPTTGSNGRAGLLNEAAGGTLFLDEIAELNLSLQAKLARFLEERTIAPTSEPQQRTNRARLIAASHRNLEEMVTNGTFREDLWYHLNVATIRVPPLRERRDDIELLATYFVRQISDRTGSRQVLGFTAAAIDAMLRYSWPGNVRQLRAAVERALLVCTASRIDVGHLPPDVIDVPAMGAGVDLAALHWTEALEAARMSAARYYLEEVLRRHGGRVAEAAAHAGVERESFYRLLRRYGARVDEKKKISSELPKPEGTAEPEVKE